MLLTHRSLVRKLFLAKQRREELSVKAERAVLVGAILPGQHLDPDDPLAELKSLTRTAGAKPVDEILVRLRQINPGTFIGKGKSQEIAQLVRAHRANVVIFDNDLTPGQIRGLEGILEVKIIDRSELILDIFAGRAQSRQARLQVELAQLEYTYPRLARMWEHLHRIGAGAPTGVGARGPGEQQLEMDRRMVRRRVVQLKSALKKIQARREREVRSRGSQFTVALVGYTNAGKSTLLNTLTGSNTLVEGRLFSTLDTKTRRWQLRSGLWVLLSDTVGFIRDLPHHLVASFRATLEHTQQADLLLHVVDVSNPLAMAQTRSCLAVLEELGLDPNRAMTLLNKIDRLEDQTALQTAQTLFPNALPISAATGQGLDRLVEEVTRIALGEEITVSIRTASANGKLLNLLKAQGNVTHREYSAGVVEIQAELPARLVDRLRQMGAAVEIIHPSDPSPTKDKT